MYPLSNCSKTCTFCLVCFRFFKRKNKRSSVWMCLDIPATSSSPCLGQGCLRLSPGVASPVLLQGAAWRFRADTAFLALQDHSPFLPHPFAWHWTPYLTAFLCVSCSSVTLLCISLSPEKPPPSKPLIQDGLLECTDSVELQCPRAMSLCSNFFLQRNKIASPSESKNKISKTLVNVSLTLRRIKADSYLARGFWNPVFSMKFHCNESVGV